MFVLVACEESQRVCIEFRKRGHIAFSCDIVECSGGHPEWHIKQDVIELINGFCDFYTSDGSYYSLRSKWDIVIAHPPCTYLSKAGARWLYPVAGVVDSKRYSQGLAAREFFMQIFNCECDKICIENPVPLKIFDLPKCSQFVQPFYFGEPYSKRTNLWLKGLPLLEPTNIVKCVDTFCPSNTSGFSKGFGGSKGSARRCKEDYVERSKTFKGLAAAMANQWG